MKGSGTPRAYEEVVSRSTKEEEEWWPCPMYGGRGVPGAEGLCLVMDSHHPLVLLRGCPVVANKQDPDSSL